MHFKEAKGILSNQNGMNIYRGCTHGCIYCDSRSNCYQMDHAFTDIEVKINAPELLEETLKKRKKKCMIGTGSMGDPYCHIENDLKLTRKCLKIIEKYGFGLCIQTKSTRLLRDLDILKRINEKSKVVVHVTLTTYQEALCKKIEPYVETTKERFKMLKILHEANIPTIVWLSPILPFINDTEENLRGIIKYCVEAKVYGIICFEMGLTLREGNREYFYQKLDEYFPGMKEIYMKNYGNSYEVTSLKNRRLLQILKDECRKNNILYGVEELFRYSREFPEHIIQLSLFKEQF